jgi:hypothetical protein
VKKLAFVVVVAMSIVGSACGKKPAPVAPTNSGTAAPDTENKMEAPKGDETPAAPDTAKPDEGSAGGDTGADSGGDAGGDSGGDEGGGDDPCGG